MYVVHTQESREGELAERLADTPPSPFEALRTSPYALSGVAMMVTAALGAVWKVRLLGAEPVSLTVGRLGILVVFGLLALDFLRTARRPRPSARAVILIASLGMLGVWIGVSAATMGCACATEVAGYAELFAMLTLAVVLGTLEPRLRVPLLAASAAGAVSAAVLALAGVSGLTPGTTNTAAYQGRLAGTYGNANYLGYAVALAFPVLLAFALTAGRAVRLIVLCAVGVMAFTLFETFSRGGLAAAAAGALVVVAMTPRRKRYGVALAAVLAGVLVALALVAYPAFREERRIATSPATSASLRGKDRSGWEGNQQGLVPRGPSTLRNDPTGQVITVSSDQAYEGLSRRFGSARQGVINTLSFEARSPTPGLLAFGLQDAKLGNGSAVRVRRVGNKWREFSQTWRPTAPSPDARLYIWQVSGSSIFEVRDVRVGSGSGQPAATRVPLQLQGPVGRSTELAAVKERRDLDVRVDGLRLGFRAMSQTPLTGLGWGDFPRYADQRSSYGPQPTHNEYMRFGAELGVLGVLLLLVAAGAVLTGFREVRSDPAGRAIVGTIVTGGVGLAFIYGLVAAAASLPLAMAAAALVTHRSGEEPAAASLGSAEQPT